jgi:hypothetical protein
MFFDQPFFLLSDGTTNFVHSNPNICTILGFMVNKVRLEKDPDPDFLPDPDPIIWINRTKKIFCFSRTQYHYQYKIFFSTY